MSTITEWLASLGLSEYAQRFAENDIAFGILPDLTDQDLEKLGLSLGHRRRMLKAIRELGDPALATLQTATAASPDSQPGTERRQLTVMFCDLVGSTAPSASLDPEDLRGIIAAYHRCCTELVERNGGFVARCMGDEVLAYFGYPRAHEHDAERAVRAGLNLVEGVPKLATNAGSPLQVRVGIATGLVVVGDLIGAGAAQEQAIVGETPNLAARLQALAEPGAVVIASSTRQLIGGLFDCRDLGTVALKGFAENVPAWQVRGASAIESRFEAMRTAMTPLIGREEEINLLIRRWEQAKRGDGQVVLISGEPGIGKSRIAQTIVERLSNEPHTRLRSFSSPHHQDSALYPTIARLERAAGFRREDTAEQRLDKLEQMLGQATNELGDAVPLLAALLSVPTGDRYPPLNLTPQKQKEKTLHALVAQLEGLAAKRPVLMVSEDVHWKDPTSLELLDLTVDRIASLSVLLIITYRPEFIPPWTGRSHVTLLSLNRLPPRQCAEMITHVIGGRIMPKEITNQIVDRTDGIPLFIEELTKAVVESGTLTETGDGYAVAGPVAPRAIPATLHASLLARLDRLVPPREVAQIAAVLGRKFSHELISAVASIPKQRLDDALAQLVTAELIFRRGTPPDAEYTFKHALVQDVAYSTLLPRQGQQIHARVVAVLESQFSEVVAAQPQIVARHCAEAGFNKKAVAYWLKSGQLAVARSAMTEAVALLQKGLDLVARLPDSPWRREHELELRIALGQALIGAKGYAAPAVGEVFARAQFLAVQLNRSDHLAPLLWGQWTFHLARSELRLALSLAERIEQIGQAEDNVVLRLLGYRVHGMTRFHLGEFVAARALFEQCHGLNDPAHRAVDAVLSAEDPYAVVLAYLAQTSTALGCVDQGRVQINKALREARRLGHVHTLVHVLRRAALIGLATGSPHETQRHAEEMVAISTEHGFAYWFAYGMVSRGSALTALGQAQEGLRLITQGLSMARATGAIIATPWMLTQLAAAYAGLGRLGESLNCVAEATQVIEATDERRDEAELYRVRGDLLNVTGDRAAAEQSYHQALVVARRQSAKLFELRSATSLACLWRDQGKRTEAGDLLAPIYGWFTEGFDTPVLQDAKALLDQLT